MKSPEQQFAFAKTLPISELAKVLQGQSDAVDMSIADMMLRIKTRADSIQKGIAAQQMVQQPKVVEKDLMEAGIAAAPVDVNVPQGGIVGSDGQMSNTGAGGGIVAFAGGSQGPIGAGKAPTSVGGGMFGRKIFGPLGMVWDLFGTSDEDKAKLLAQDEAKNLLKIQGLSDEDISRLSLDDLFGAAQAYGYQGGRGKPMTQGMTEAQKKLYDQAEQARITGNPVLPGADQKPLVLDDRSQVAGAAGATRRSMADEAQKKYIKQMLGGEDSGIAKLLVNKETAPAASSSSVRGPRSFDDAYEEASRIAAKISPLTKPEVPSTAMAVQTEKDILGAAGYDFNMYKDQIKELKEDAEKDKSRKSEAMNMRLLEAGLGILGGESPHAFVNIGKGATPAAKGLAEDIKEIQKLDRERRKEMRTLATAQNQVAAGIGGKASERLQKAQERVDRLDEREQALRTDLAKTLHSADTQKYIADKAAATQKEIAAMPGKDERLYRSLATDPELVKGVEAYAKATGQNKETLLAALIKDPFALNTLKTNNKELYAMIMSKITASLVPPVTTKPDASKIRQ